MILNRRQFLTSSSLYASCLSGLVIPPLALAQQRTVEAETQFGRVKGIQFGAVNVFKGILTELTPGVATVFNHQRTQARGLG